MIYVIAGNYEQFTNYCILEGLIPRDRNIKYISEQARSNKVRYFNTSEDQLVLYGTYWERNDMEELAYALIPYGFPPEQLRSWIGK